MIVEYFECDSKKQRGSFGWGSSEIWILSAERNEKNQRKRRFFSFCSALPSTSLFLLSLSSFSSTPPSLAPPQVLHLLTARVGGASTNSLGEISALLHDKQKYIPDHESQRHYCASQGTMFAPFDFDYKPSRITRQPVSPFSLRNKIISRNLQTFVNNFVTLYALENSTDLSFTFFTNFAISFRHFLPPIHLFSFALVRSLL